MPPPDAVPAPDLDAEDPTPLYHQIVLHLRWCLLTGRLEPGQRLPAIRAAAEAWGVNYHTVRRAYGALTEAGILRSEPGAGTRVRDDGPEAAAAAPATDKDLAAFLAEVLDVARERFGVGGDALLRHLADTAGPTSPASSIGDARLVDAGGGADAEAEDRPVRKPFAAGALRPSAGGGTSSPPAAQAAGSDRRVGPGRPAVPSPERAPAGREPGAGEDAPAAAHGSVQELLFMDRDDERLEGVARRLERGWQLEVRPWHLDRPGRPPGKVLAAPAEYAAELRMRWPDLGGRAHLLPSSVDPALIDAVAAAAQELGLRRVSVCAPTLPLARSSAARMAETLPARLDVDVHACDAGDAVFRGPPGAILVCVPALHDRLPERARSAPHVFEFRQGVPEEALADLAAQLGASAR